MKFTNCIMVTIFLLTIGYSSITTTAKTSEGSHAESSWLQVHQAANASSRETYKEKWTIDKGSKFKAHKTPKVIVMWNKPMTTGKIGLGLGYNIYANKKLTYAKYESTSYNNMFSATRHEKIRNKAGKVSIYYYIESPKIHGWISRWGIFFHK